MSTRRTPHIRPTVASGLTGHVQGGVQRSAPAGNTPPAGPRTALAVNSRTRLAGTCRPGFDDADEALRQWLPALEGYLSTFSGLPEPVLAALASHSSPLAAGCERLIAITDDLFRAAQEHGTVRLTVRGKDLFLTALFLAWTDNAPVDGDALPTLRRLLETGYSTS